MVNLKRIAIIILFVFLCGCSKAKDTTSTTKNEAYIVEYNKMMRDYRDDSKKIDDQYDTLKQQRIDEFYRSYAPELFLELALIDQMYEDLLAQYKEDSTDLSNLIIEANKTLNNSKSPEERKKIQEAISFFEEQKRIILKEYNEKLSIIYKEREIVEKALNEKIETYRDVLDNIIFCVDEERKHEHQKRTDELLDSLSELDRKYGG